MGDGEVRVLVSKFQERKHTTIPQSLVWMIIINYLKLLRTGFQAVALVFSWIAIGA